MPALNRTENEKPADPIAPSAPYSDGFLTGGVGPRKFKPFANGQPNRYIDPVWLLVNTEYAVFSKRLFIDTGGRI